jgi:hypothetical protein
LRFHSRIEKFEARYKNVIPICVYLKLCRSSGASVLAFYFAALCRGNMQGHSYAKLNEGQWEHQLSV